MRNTVLKRGLAVALVAAMAIPLVPAYAEEPDPGTVPVGSDVTGTGSGADPSQSADLGTQLEIPGIPDIPDIETAGENETQTSAWTLKGLVFDDEDRDGVRDEDEAALEGIRVRLYGLEKYSQDLAAKPRWLVFNKIDLLDKAEAEEKAKAIAEALGWEDKYYLISAASGLGVKDLCWDVMTFIIENPVVQAEEAKQPEKVEFMWDDYHRQQLEEIAEEDDEDWDDDWDEDDEEGVEFIYKR